MDKDDAISLSEDESGDEPYIDRRAILEGPIRSVVDALGGLEGDAYRLGDECYGCLKDLKKFWRKDDTDDDRTVARIFWSTNVLTKDLIPILLETAGKGLVEDKRAIACADLMTAMTWPIDLAEELKELDDEFDRGTDYTQLLFAHLNYKAALLRPGVLQALLAITLPCLAKDAKERTERDVQIVNVVLHLIRNLAFIKDPPPNMYGSADQAEFSTLQSRLVKGLSESHFLDLLLTIASNAGDTMFNQWNTVILEIFCLLFRGVQPSSLASDQAKQSTKALQNLLAKEDQRKRELARKATSRHSRFGTTISVMLNPKKAKPAEGANAPQEEDNSGATRAYVLHKQQALNKDSGSALDMIAAKKHRAPRNKKTDELGRDDNLSLDARVVLQNLARSFIEGCFNPLVASLLKDIKAERAKITEKDHMRLLFVTKWFLEFFLCERSRQPEGSRWKFGLIAEVIDRGWIVWVLRRMREAQDEKPKLWTELQAGIECLTQFVLTLDVMSSTPPAPAADPDADPFTEAENSAEEDVAEAARLLQQQIVYNGEVLDISFESVRTYKEGTQSLAYLDASIHLAYALLRMLEKWSKRQGKGEMYVRKKPKPKKKRSARSTEEGEGVPDVEEEEPQQAEEEEIINETMFTFEQYERRFVHSDVTHTLLVYLARWKEFSSAEQMKRVVGLIHRQAVRQKAEGLYFMVSTLYLFKQIMAEERSLPKDQPYKDLVALINYILRKFFKAVAEDSFLVVEAFFPKNRGHWKQFSSAELEEVGSRPGRLPFDSRFPQDVQVKKGYSWSEQVGIAMAALIEKGQQNLIEWTRQILSLAIAHRQKIIEDVDGAPSSKTIDLTAGDSDAESDMNDVLGRRPPSKEAAEKINDYLIPYVNDEEAEAANKNPNLKLLFRLCNFKILDEDAEEVEWYIPSAIYPAEMQQTLSVINQFLEKPLDLEGKSASDLLQKKRRRRTRRRREPTPDSDAEDSDAPRRKKKKERKKKEVQQYKSAQFIEDSDAEYGDMDAFLEREKALREKTARLAAETGQAATMRMHGTKKRRRKGKDSVGKKRRKRGGEAEEGGEDGPEEEKAQQSNASSDESEFDVFGSPKRGQSEPTPDTSPPMGEEQERLKVKPRPRPRPVPRAPQSPAATEGQPSRFATPVHKDLASTPGFSESGDQDVVKARSRSPSLSRSDEEVPTADMIRGKRKARIVIDEDEDE
ncbi:timeless-domain-containing protein [Trametes elegans]|nr:timeless-domain-containing protein [Trametes elegans]